MRITNVRSAVQSLQEPLVMACPELTIDRVVNDYMVSSATTREDENASFHPMTGYSIAQTVAMKIEGAHMPHNKGTRQSANSIYAVY